MSPFSSAFWHSLLATHIFVTFNVVSFPVVSFLICYLRTAHVMFLSASQWLVLLPGLQPRVALSAGPG